MARAVQALVKAPTTLSTHPRIGEQLIPFESRETWRLLVGQYQMRQEVFVGIIDVPRPRHTREVQQPK